MVELAAKSLCERRDLNPHSFRSQILRVAPPSGTPSGTLCATVHNDRTEGHQIGRSGTEDVTVRATPLIWSHYSRAFALGGWHPL